MAGRVARITASIAVIALLALFYMLSEKERIVVDRDISGIGKAGGNYFILRQIPDNFDPVGEVKWLRRRGVDVKEAWYKPYSPSCCPKGSEVCLMVVVKPVFIVRTEGGMPEGYELSENPDLGICPFNAVHISVE